MKTKNTIQTLKAANIDGTGDTTKLLSLLALASGAMAIPQTSNADIIYTDLRASPAQVGFSGAADYVVNNLPGGAFLRFFRSVMTTTSPFTRSTNVVRVQGSNRRYVGVKDDVNGFAAVVSVAAQPGPVWGQIPGGSFTGGAMGVSSTFLGGRNPGAYASKYLAFVFFDSTHSLRDTYGWVNVGLSYTANGPDVTIFGYAYDNTGSQIPMGAGVPEPSSTALLALGALTLGAAGVRKWRRNRAAAGQP